VDGQQERLRNLKRMQFMRQNWLSTHYQIIRRHRRSLLLHLEHTYRPTVKDHGDRPDVTGRPSVTHCENWYNTKSKQAIANPANQASGRRCGNELSRECCNVSSDVVSILPTHRKIHLRVWADERRHEIILVKSVFSTNNLKGRRVRDDTP
jgi:hypothetical protein